MEIIADNDLRLEWHEATIPWLKIFTVEPYKEMSEAPEALRLRIWRLLDALERRMLEYYAPEKINIASFGNYVPHLHWHIMARFVEDSHFPEPMWGVKQREGALSLPPKKPFEAQIWEVFLAID